MCRVASLESVGLGIDEAPISYDVRAWVMDRAAEARADVAVPAGPGAAPAGAT